MSTQTVSASQADGGKRPARTPAAKKRLPPKECPLKCSRKPGLLAEKALRDAAWQLVENHYTYEEAQELLRLYMMRAAMKCCKDVKKHAAERLGISRVHLDNYLVRGKELMG